MGLMGVQLQLPHRASHVVRKASPLPGCRGEGLVLGTLLGAGPWRRADGHPLARTCTHANTQPQNAHKMYTKCARIHTMHIYTHNATHPPHTQHPPTHPPTQAHTHDTPPPEAIKPLSLNGIADRRPLSKRNRKKYEILFDNLHLKHK